MPLRAIYRRAIARGEVEVNPTTGLELPAVRSKRDRIASPEEAAALIAALPEQDRALWATAMYAGLRRGELMALRWDHLDLIERRDPRRALVGRQGEVRRAEEQGRAPDGPDPFGAAELPSRAPTPVA